MSPIGSKIDFWRNFILESAAGFYIIILKFIFTPIFEIEIHEKKSWHQKNFILGYVMISVTTIWIYHMWMKLKYERKPVKSLVLSTFAIFIIS